MSAAGPGAVLVVWDDGFTAYDFGPGHPMGPARLALTARLCQDMGVFDHPDVEVISPQPAPDEVLTQVHDPAYVAAVQRASADPTYPDLDRGIGTEDDPAFAGMHEAAARIAGGTLQLCQEVWAGRARRGVNFCGGMHHAMPDRAAGFCIYNDAAVGIQAMLDAGAERVAYVDVDVHHGDGVERIFWDDPRVLTLSVHENGRVLFPGTGWPGDTGGPGAPGSAVNVALPPGTGDAGWLRAIHATVLPVLRAFAPQVVVSQHGCDTHAQDPLAHLTVSVDAQRLVMQTVAELTEELCDGRWVALGGGGYELVDVVPRSWTHLTAIAAGAPIDLDTPVPATWRAFVSEQVGRQGPERMGDLDLSRGPIWYQPWDMGFNPDSEADRAVMATREATFAQHGLDVWFD